MKTLPKNTTKKIKLSQKENKYNKEIELSPELKTLFKILKIVLKQEDFMISSIESKENKNQIIINNTLELFELFLGLGVFYFGFNTRK